MNVDDVISRIRRGEDSLTQFKRQSVGVAKLADEMVAFANAEGGVILKSGVSCARNATIASFASKELPYRGLGTGVKRAVEVMPDIQFESDRGANWLKAIVRRENKDGTADSTTPDQNPTRTRPKVLDGLSASCGLVYDAIVRDKRLTYRKMAEMLKLNKDTINTAVQTLIDCQLIRRVGPKKGGWWEVIG